MKVALRAMLEGFMSVTNLFEEVNLILPGEERSSKAVNGSISPAFVVEATLLVKMLEVLCVSLPAPEVKISDLEITPD
jgi:hypothetical protein